MSPSSLTSHLFILLEQFLRQWRDVLLLLNTHCRCTSQPPADVSLPFPGHRCGGFDSCACLLSRQENHRAEVKKHVLPNCVSIRNGVPGKSFETTLPAWVAYGEEFKKCVETAVVQERKSWNPWARGPMTTRGTRETLNLNGGHVDDT